MYIPWSKTRWDLGISVDFCHPDADYLSTPSFRVAFFCLYLWCFSAPEGYSPLPQRHLCSYETTLFYKPKPEVFTIARSVFHLQSWVSMLLMANITPPLHCDLNESPATSLVATVMHSLSPSHPWNQVDQVLWYQISKCLSNLPTFFSLNYPGSDYNYLLPGWISNLFTQKPGDSFLKCTLNCIKHDPAPHLKYLKSINDSPLPTGYYLSSFLGLTLWLETLLLF